MNVIGEIGNFIIKYQEPIQAAVIFAIIVAAVVIIVKLLAGAKRKREILSQINDTVSEINTAVNHLNDKKADVIYIDSRMTQETGEPAVQETDAQSESCEDAVPGPDTPPDGDGADAGQVKEEKIEPSLKYFSRDCAISKTGRQFTLEELNAQIKD